MISAAEARSSLNISNSMLLKGIEQKIETAINKAIINLQSSVNVYLDKYLEKVGQDQILKNMRELGYTIEYKSFSSMRAEDSTEYFAIRW